MFKGVWIEKCVFIHTSDYYLEEIISIGLHPIIGSLEAAKSAGLVPVLSQFIHVTHVLLHASYNKLTGSSKIPPLLFVQSTMQYFFVASFRFSFVKC